MSLLRVLVLVGCTASTLGALAVLLVRRWPETLRARAGVALLIFAMGVVVAVVTWFAFAFAELPVTFRRALASGDDDAAYQMLGERAQRDFGSSLSVGAWAERMAPETWRFGSSCGTIGLGRSDGRGRYPNGEAFSITIHVGREDEVWRVIGIEWWDDAYHRRGTTSGIDCSDF